MNTLMYKNESKEKNPMEGLNGTNETFKSYWVRLSTLDENIARANQEKADLVRGSLSDLTIPEAAILAQLSDICMDCFWNMVSDSFSVEYRESHQNS